MNTQRSTVVSLELLLDAGSEARIRAEWEALAGAGLSSLAAHTAPSNRPHVTVLVRPRIPSLSMRVLAEAVPLPLPVTLGAPVLFGAGERRVLARSIVPSRELLALHAAVHALAGPGDDAPHSRPSEWMPHVTLARRLRVEALAEALQLLDGVAPHPPAHPTGAVTGLRRWDAGPATVTSLLPAPAGG